MHNCLLFCLFAHETYLYAWCQKIVNKNVAIAAFITGSSNMAFVLLLVTDKSHNGIRRVGIYDLAVAKLPAYPILLKTVPSSVQLTAMYPFATPSSNEEIIIDRHARH